jgi:hypothetical protein
VSGFAGQTVPGSTNAAPPPPPPPSPAQAVEAIGRPTPAQLARSHRLLEELPPALHDAAHEPFGARAVIYALLLDADVDSCQRQFERLAAEADPAVYQITTQLHELSRNLPRDLRLPLVDICLGPLKELSPEQYERFRDNVHALAAADKRLSLFEWTLQKVVLHVLDPHFRRRRRHRVRRPTPADVSVVLSALAHAGGGGAEAVHAAFERGARAARLESLTLQPWDSSIFTRLDKAIDALDRLSAKSKARLVQGLAETAAADGKIIPRELELLRAVATTLDCPMPLVA